MMLFLKNGTLLYYIKKKYDLVSRKSTDVCDDVVVSR